jgi:hypothetical protein
MTVWRRWIGKKGRLMPRLSCLSAAPERQALPQKSGEIRRKPNAMAALRTGNPICLPDRPFNAEQDGAYEPICGIARAARVVQCVH